MYIDKLDDIVNKYNNAYHRTIKIKPNDVKDNTYINIGKEVSDNDPEFKVGDHVRISKYKNIFAKGYAPNWSEEIFVNKEIKNRVPYHRLMGELLEHSMKKNCKDKSRRSYNRKSNQEKR